MHIGSIRNGIILISAGIVLLLNSLGYVDWEVWEQIVSLWPVVLICWGIEMVFKHTRLKFLALLSPILYLLAILGPALANFEESVEETWAASRTTFSLSESDIEKIEADLDFKAGEIFIGSDKKNIFIGRVVYAKEKPLYKYSISDKKAHISLSQESWSIESGRRLRQNNWEIEFKEKIPLDLKLKTIASDSELDFCKLNLEEFNYCCWATKSWIKLDKIDSAEVNIRSYASKIHLLIPREVGLRLLNKTFLSADSFTEFSLNENDSFTSSENFQTSPYKLYLTLTGGFSKFELERY